MHSSYGFALSVDD